MEAGQGSYANDGLVVIRGRRIRRRVLTWGSFAVFLLALLASIEVWGMPWSKDRLALWVIAGLLAVSITDLRGWARSVAIDWAPFFFVLFSYDLLRGYADQLRTPYVLPQLRADEVLFGGTVPTITLQQAFYRPGDPQWYDYAAWAVYTSHFFMAFLVAAVLWKFAYHHFRRWIAMFVGLTFAGFATYAAFPAVPPWLASRMGPCVTDATQQCYLEPTTRLIGPMWQHVGVDQAATIFQGGSRYANDVAALPSLHSAYPALLLLFLWPYVGRIGRALLVAYPLAMAVTLVYGAEHYVADILLGWLYAGIIYVVVQLWWHRRHGHGAQPPAQHETATGAPVVDAGSGQRADAPTPLSRH